MPSLKNVGDQEVQMDRRRAKDRRGPQAKSNDRSKVATRKVEKDVAEIRKPSATSKTNSRKAANKESSKVTSVKPALVKKIEASCDTISNAIDATEPPKTFQPARRKQQRRRQIDPTTCEREYNGPEIEFMQAIDAYKRSSGRMFPTCSEILEVITKLGYVRLTDEERDVLKNIQEVGTDIEQSMHSPSN